MHFPAPTASCCAPGAGVQGSAGIALIERHVRKNAADPGGVSAHMTFEG